MELSNYGVMTKVEYIQEYLEKVYPGQIRHDVVTDKVQINDAAKLPNDEMSAAAPLNDVNAHWRELTKKDVNTMVCECAAGSSMNITDREVRCVLNSDFVPSVHPLREYILSLPEFDPNCGVDPIDMLAGQVHVAESDKSLVVGRSNLASLERSASLYASLDDNSQERWRKVFKKWFVAMVASWMSDEVVNQHVLVLIGKQGIYKTTWLERLLPPELRGYGSKLANLHDLTKDDRLRIAECALINIDEIDALNDRELNQMKSVITAADVNERAAYAYSKERRMRLASFCASGNKREFLTDTTGNRRWLPFEVESIDSPFDNAVQPYKFYYAQAWWLIRNGFNYWFASEDVRALEDHVESFRRTTSEEDLLPVYYSPASLDDSGAVLRTAAEMLSKLTWQGTIKHPMSLSAFGKLLSAKGYEQKRIGHDRHRAYLVIENQRNMATDQAMIDKLKAEENADNADTRTEVF